MLCWSGSTAQASVGGCKSVPHWSAAIVFVLLSAVNLAKRYHLDVNVPPVVLSLVGAGTVYEKAVATFDVGQHSTPSGIGHLVMLQWV